MIEQFTRPCAGGYLGSEASRYVQVKFGNPRTGCKGYGICRIMIGEGLPLSAGVSPCEIRLLHSGFLEWIFPRSALVQAQIGQGVFQISHPVELPGEVFSLFGFSRIQVEPGFFPVRHAGAKLYFRTRISMEKPKP